MAGGPRFPGQLSAHNWVDRLSPPRFSHPDVGIVIGDLWRRGTGPRPWRADRGRAAVPPGVADADPDPAWFAHQPGDSSAQPAHLCSFRRHRSRGVDDLLAHSLRQLAAPPGLADGRHRSFADTDGAHDPAMALQPTPGSRRHRKPGSVPGERKAARIQRKYRPEHQ